MFKGFKRPPQKPEPPPCLVCLCGAKVLPLHTLNHPRCSAPASRLNLQAGCLCWRLDYLLLQEALPGGKSTLAKTASVFCQVGNRLPPQAQGQFKLPQMGCSGHSYVVKFPFLGAVGHHGKSEMPNSCPPLGVGRDGPQALWCSSTTTELRAATRAHLGNVSCLAQVQINSFPQEFIYLSSIFLSIYNALFNLEEESRFWFFISNMDVSDVKLGQFSIYVFVTKSKQIIF